MTNSFLLSKFGKKAQAQNWFAVIVVLFSFGALSMIGYVVTSSIIDAFASTSYYTGAVASAGQSFLNSLLMFDKIIVLIMIVLVVGVAVTSYRLATAPVFFVITWIMGGLYGFVSYFFNYIFAQLASHSVFTSVLAYFPITILICTNLHWIMLVCIIVGSITLYAKKEQGQFMT